MNKTVFRCKRDGFTISGTEYRINLYCFIPLYVSPTTPAAGKCCLCGLTRRI